MTVTDVKAQIRPYNNCPVFYASDSAAAGFESVFTRLPAKDLFNSRKRRLVLTARRHWHHGSGRRDNELLHRRHDGQLDAHAHAPLSASCGTGPIAAHGRLRQG